MAKFISLADRVTEVGRALRGLLDAADAGAESALHDEENEHRSFALQALSDVRSTALRLRAVVEHLAQLIDPAPPASFSGAHLSVATPPSGSAPLAGAERAQILVIEDDAPTGRYLQRLLRDCDVVVLDRSKEAFARIRRGERFDLILCDMAMPEVAGHALYEALVERVPDQAWRFVLMTGGARTQDADAFLESTACAVLQKPFRGADVLKLLHASLNPNEGAPRLGQLANASPKA